MNYSRFLIAVVLLSLASWVAFYVWSTPLLPAETVVVVGFWALVAAGVRAVLRRRAGARKDA